ncbi:MAG: glyoxalase [Planctomycetaceae bacterium]|jgi:catechol 2,3-dioxygenase-like lactoylglutathione lyase family enzyme|nr:glyoxalase [Planctomycetaceae bacterium]MBT6484261.1 glyoxalase [Planctomycetaceae bacterium]MBT6498067.1 glyoxalase [Planctomycetaceae bacterium]
MTAPAPIVVRTIDHVTLVVKDLEASRKFYCDLLGMEEQDRPNFSFGGSWFQAGVTQIHLILEHDESGPAGENISIQKQSSRNHHFAFEVADGHAAAQILQERGIPLVAGPKARPDGAVQVFVNDPDGYVVELTSPPIG